MKPSPTTTSKTSPLTREILLIRPKETDVADDTRVETLLCRTVKHVGERPVRKTKGRKRRKPGERPEVSSRLMAYSHEAEFQTASQSEGKSIGNPLTRLPVDGRLDAG